MTRAGRVVATILLSALAVTACDDDGGTADRPPDRTASPSPTDRNQEASLPKFNPDGVTLELEPVVESGLSSPLGLVDAGDASGRLFVVEQTGAIRVLRGDGLADKPFLDISSLITAGGEQGLLGLAFHPGFASNRRFFVDYTNVDGDTVIAEYRVSKSNPDAADPGSAHILLTIDQPFSNHNGGQLAFGPDGYLYIAMGDGGSADDPQGNGQNLNTLLAKLLRIDVDSTSGARQYGIPPDNPFVGRDDARPEIWAYGLRNPWRFSFDVAAGKLWIGDVGQESLEEVDRVDLDDAGLNFGWNVMEGSSCFTEPRCDKSGLVLPIAEYDHDLGCSITGGFVYRGAAYPELLGGYFFGDYCSGRIWAIDAAARRPQEPVVAAETDLSISSFGLDEDGELYVVDLAGRVFRVTRSRG